MTAELGGVAYAAAFVASLGLTLVFTPVLLRFASRRQIVDLPGGHKSHSSPVPYLGGIGIVLAFSVAVMAAALIAPLGGAGDLAWILGLAVLLSLMGLIDDLRGLSRLLRLFVEIGAGVGVWWIGGGVSLFAAEPANLAITVLWVVGITNAFNLLDNMDGLSGGVAAIGAFFFFLLAALNGQFLVATLAIALAGCAVGFLKHNFHPAKIYMGDAGSLFLGFLLAVLGMRLRFDAPTQVTFMVPILVLGVAMFDTTLVVITRLLHGRHPMEGGRDHTSHRLVFVGIPVPAAVSLIYMAGISLGWLAVVMSRLDRGSGYLLMGLVLTLGLFAGTLLGLVPVYENSKRKRMMLQEVGLHDEEPAR
jgi:UDP-GlcNAc:undecaprenyl-phosphate/decaprenyl-phosphate GlcNAc-1-phosphate transferase